MPFFSFIENKIDEDNTVNRKVIDVDDAFFRKKHIDVDDAFFF